MELVIPERHWNSELRTAPLANLLTLIPAEAETQESTMLVTVLVAAEIVLLVKVWVAVRVTAVSVMSGKVMVLLIVVEEARVRDVAVVAEEDANPMVLVASVESTWKQLALEKDLLVRVSVVDRPTKVSVEVGKLIVPVLMTDEMMGAVRVLLVKVWVAVRATRVSVASGKVMVLLAVMLEARVKVVEVVAPDERKPTFLVESVGSTWKTVLLKRDLLERLSVVALPTRVSVEVGKLMVPVLMMDEMVGVVRVLLVRV